MRELTVEEVDNVGGGVLPFIAAVVLVDLALIAFTIGVADGYTAKD